MMGLLNDDRADDELVDDEEYGPPAPRVIDRVYDALDWQDNAACRNSDPELFFGPVAERPEAARARESFAKDAFCAGCMVAVECRDFARRHREYGLWAETEHERVAAGFAPDMPVGVSARMRSLLRRGLVAR